MKLNWGTGVVLFLALFLIAMISFVIFAWHQDVNLVHEDYYEKGADFSKTMETGKRSVPFDRIISVIERGDSVGIIFPSEAVKSAGSGSVTFFRPSDHNRDIRYPLVLRDSVFLTGKSNLIPGRYIIKICWTSEGMEYEVDKNWIFK